MALFGDKCERRELVITSCLKRTHLVWGNGEEEEEEEDNTTYLVNITNKNLTFELTQKHSASKSQHC